MNFRTIFALAWLAIIITGAVGWCFNIGAIIAADFSHVTGLIVLRLIGVFVAPLGAFLGLFI